MKQSIYHELAKSIAEIRQKEVDLNADEKQEEKTKVFETMRDVVCINLAGSKAGYKGIIGSMQEKKSNKIEYLQKMIRTFFEGMKLEIVEEIFQTKYYTLELKDYDRLCYLIILCGFRSIVTYEDPYITEQRLIAMFPKGWENEYKQIVLTDFRGNTDYIDENRQYLYTGRLVVSPEEKCYLMMQLTNYAIENMNEKKLLKLIWELDNDTLVKLTKGLSGEARYQVLKVLSARCANMLVNDLEIMGQVTTDEVAKATKKVFGMMLKTIIGEEYA